jgi:acylphosphatase
MIAKHVNFKGRVQGVGFRYSCYRMAAGYEVTGFVRNLPDGSVELWAQGPANEVEAYLGAVEAYFGNAIRESTVNTTPMNPRYERFEIAY